MAINSDIRDHAYQFFTEEAPELLQMIETGILTLNQERSTAKVHNLMRAAHSLKGGSSSVGLTAIATLAHRLENIFKALYNEALILDSELESRLLQAYDCLRLPLVEQIETGYFDADGALAIANPIFGWIEERCGDALTDAEGYMPSSEELGVDMLSSIFEVDVAQGLERLADVLTHPHDYEIAGELRAQAEVFTGFAEFLNLPGFGAIAEATLRALDAHPDRALELTQLALTNFETSRHAILAGDRTGGLGPSAALMAFANSAASDPLDGMDNADEMPDYETFEDDGVIALEYGINSSDETPEPTHDAIDLFATIDVEWSENFAWNSEFDLALDAATTDAAVEESAADLFWGNPNPEFSLEAAIAELTSNNSDHEDVAEDADEMSAFEMALDEVVKGFLTEETTTATFADHSIEMLLDTDISESSLEETRYSTNDNDIDDASSLDISLEIDLADINFDPIDRTNSTIDLHQDDIFFSENIAEYTIEAATIDTELEETENFLEPMQTPITQFEEDIVLAAPHLPQIEFLDGYLEESSAELTVDALTAEFSIDDTENTLSIYESQFDPEEVEYTETLATLEVAFQSFEQLVDRLPSAPNPVSPALPPQLSLPTAPELSAAQKPGSLVPSTANAGGILQLSETAGLKRSTGEELKQKRVEIPQSKEPNTPNLTVRVDSARLERMNNLVGELAINRDGLSLQNEQLQGSLRQLLNRFARFQTMINHLREISDQMLVAPEHNGYSSRNANTWNQTEPRSEVSSKLFTTVDPLTSTEPAAEFDPLEMDSYGATYLQLQEIFEDTMQLEEAVEDITLFAKQSDQMLNQQRQMLTNLRDELIRARMLPLSDVTNRFPRLLRDMSATYHKPVNLKLTGAGVLVEKAILEKLYDPLLHLLRNAFDHGIEPLNIRHRRGKPEQGQIEIRAYHKGNHTMIEVKDDGQGLNLDRIRRRAFELGWLSTEQLLTTPPEQLFELIFEPGFSTAPQVSELSGRGVGLDVVRSQLHLIKGTVSVVSSPEQGATFTLTLPLTLTIVKLIICLVGSTILALSADSIEAILTPQPDQTRSSGTHRFLYWRDQIIPAYRLGDLLEYACPLPERTPSKALGAIASPKDWAPPMLVLRQGQQIFALEVDRLVTEQELVIKSFGAAIAPPSYTYGCTILGDGSLVPVIDGIALLTTVLHQGSIRTATSAESELTDAATHPSHRGTVTPIQIVQAPTILVVDDSVTLRRTLALSLERAGFRVLQARDGREAIEQLQQSLGVKLIICDIEMPGMNGFEFLNYRRQDPQLATIPIVMLTSRSNDKHRWLATQLGAVAYFTKPYLEQEFFSAVKDIIDNIH